MSRRRQLLIYSAVALVTLYGALLRLDAYVGKYGTLDRPGWARFVTHDVAPIARRIRPASVSWTRDTTPYVGGDPIGYLKFGREMTTFYQPHVREPVFVSAVHVSLWALDGQDAGVSLASAAGSVLMIAATFLLGAALAGPLAGLGAACIIAIEYDLIIWSVDGWRDDWFSAFVVLSAWSLLRLHERPTFRRAVAAGIVCGLTCLTRITALSFVVPAFVWIALAGGRPLRRDRLEFTALAGGLAAAVLAPFLISCAIASGDPFLSIDQHTMYYRAAEGLSVAKPMSTAAYLRQKFAAHPIGMVDTGVTGLIVRPFATKWDGLRVWTPWLGRFLFWAALAGLAASMYTSKGRLLLLIVATSLLPYAFTWNVGDGGAWRFTMHAYPLYVVAALYAITLVPHLFERSALPSFARRTIAVLAGAAAASAIYVALPWFVVREAIGRGDSVSVAAGPRDVTFFRSGWSAPVAQGNLMVRLSREPRAVVHFPLPAKDDYDVVVRLDPLAGSGMPATVLFNQQVVGRETLEQSPGRIGSYRFSLPRDWQTAGDNELAIACEGKTGIRLWLVRVLPLRAR